MNSVLIFSSSIFQHLFLMPGACYTLPSLGSLSSNEFTQFADDVTPPFLHAVDLTVTLNLSF